MENKDKILMTYNIDLISSKEISGKVSKSKLNIKGFELIEDFLPTEGQLRSWAQESIMKVILKQEIDLIHIKVKQDHFIKIVKGLYSKLGKQIIVDEGLLFKIPTRKKNAFFENINQLVLNSDQLKMPIIVIHI